MIPIKNEGVSTDVEGLKKAENMLSSILHDKGILLKGNKEIWKSLITLRTWLKKAIEDDGSAVLQIRCYADKLIHEAAHEIHMRGHEEQRMEEESPLLTEKAVRLKSAEYFDAYNGLLAIHELLKKRQLIGSDISSIPIAV